MPPNLTPKIREIPKLVGTHNLITPRGSCVALHTVKKQGHSAMRPRLRKSDFEISCHNSEFKIAYPFITKGEGKVLQLVILSFSYDLLLLPSYGLAWVSQYQHPTL